MPVLLDGFRSTEVIPPWIGQASGVLTGRTAATSGETLDIGIVNNMPDTALQATERQFISLIAAAAGDRMVRVHLFSLPSVARGEAARTHMATLYGPIETLGRVPLDALIVTGCEPIAASLRDEPYWDSMTRLVDWAEHNTTSTLWSCLAAHAAVLHLDGIARRRLPAKRAGVFHCDLTRAHPLTEGLGGPMQVSHSRWNDLPEADLLAHDYEILTRSPHAGVNLFAKQLRSLFVFFQGHPEYDADSIGREYRRDVARYLRGERDDYPSVPHSYFDEATESLLESFRARALVDRTAVHLRDLPRTLTLRPGLEADWHATVVPVFRNWLDLLAERRR